MSICDQQYCVGVAIEIVGTQRLCETDANIVRLADHTRRRGPINLRTPDDLLNTAEAEHGTTRGYSAHRKAGTAPCWPCIDAQAIYQADYKPRRLILERARTAKRLLAAAAA